jgi:hypothetical protein
MSVRQVGYRAELLELLSQRRRVFENRIGNHLIQTETQKTEFLRQGIVQVPGDALPLGLGCAPQSL